MAFKDLLQKGLESINKGVDAAATAAKEKKAAMQEFDLLKTRSDHIGPMSPYEEKNADPQLGKEQLILNACLTISVEQARLVNKLLPIDETVLNIKNGKEAKTEIEYIFVITDKRLWILNKNEYMTYEFETIKECSIVNKGLMSQSVKFDDKAFTLDGKEPDITDFFSLLKNPEYRKDVTAHKIAYLAGVTPRKQMLNMLIRGITFGDAGTIVLHNGQENRVVNIKDIETVQLLINDTIALAKGKSDSSNFMSAPLEARKMSIKFIFGMGDFVIETMPQNMMNTSYKREDQTYINNYEFAKSIVDTIGTLVRKFQ